MIGRSLAKRFVASTTAGACVALLLSGWLLVGYEAHARNTAVVLDAPDFVQISVTQLSAVKDQLRNALGISWGETLATLVPVTLENGTHEIVRLTRMYSRSSHPYIELIHADPQIGPWVPFDDEFGQRPRTTMVWRVGIPEFSAAKNQMEAAGLTQIAVGPGFAYYKTVSGVQLEVIRSTLAPDPAHGKPNEPPPGKIDLGALNHLSIALRPNPAPNQYEIPDDNTTLRAQITAATGGGIQWDLIAQFVPPGTPEPGIPYFNEHEQLVSFLHPNIDYACNPHPFLNSISTIPNIAPLGATATSTIFSHAWVPSGSGLDASGAAVMEAAENQVLAAGLQSTLRLDARFLGLTQFPVNIFHYFTGIDNVDIQLLNSAFENHPTSQCTTLP